MEFERHVLTLRQQLSAVAATGDDVVRAVADALGTALDPAVRVVLLEVLSDAAADLSRDLAPTSVDVRLRGREPELVVTRADAPAPAPTEAGDDGATSRTTLRLPDHLKARAEAAAAQEGISVNSWLVRAVSAALERDDRRAAPPDPRTGNRFTGWAR